MSPFYCHLFFYLKTSPKGTLSLRLSLLEIPNGFPIGLPCQPRRSVLSSWFYDVRLLYTPITCYRLFHFDLLDTWTHSKLWTRLLYIILWVLQKSRGWATWEKHLLDLGKFLCGTFPDMEFTPFKEGQSRLANLQL